MAVALARWIMFTPCAWTRPNSSLYTDPSLFLSGSGLLLPPPVLAACAAAHSSAICSNKAIAVASAARAAGAVIFARLRQPAAFLRLCVDASDTDTKICARLESLVRVPAR